VSRGAGYVATQFVLMGAILLAVLAPPGWPADGRELRFVAAAVLGIAGLAICVAAGRVLGSGLTPCPQPVDGAPLAESGPYDAVRHPFYSGALLLFTGWSLVAGPVALALTVGLAVLWEFKARLEEAHLRLAYPTYEAYAERVRWRFLPGVH